MSRNSVCEESIDDRVFLTDWYMRADTAHINSDCIIKLSSPCETGRSQRSMSKIFSVFWKSGFWKRRFLDFIKELSERLPAHLRLRFSGSISWASKINNLVSKHKPRLIKKKKKMQSWPAGTAGGFKVSQQSCFIWFMFNVSLLPLVMLQLMDRLLL